jgi:cell division GTPase FtsZ
MLSLVGVGGAGCRIVDSFYRKDIVSSIIDRIAGKSTEYVRGVVIDTSDTVASLSNIPAENSALIGSSWAKGHGTGGDVELGRKIMNEEAGLALNVIRRVYSEKPDMFFLIAGVGGGTGTGGFDVLAGKLKRVYKVPIIGILVFPSRGEGSLYVKNAYENFDMLTKSVDAAILLDNNVLTKKGEDILTTYRIVDNTIFNFLSMVEPMDILRITKGKVSTIGFMRTKSGYVSIKYILDKMLRDHIHITFDIKKAGKLYLVIYGDMRKVYGQNFAKKWTKEKFGIELDYIFKDDPHSKYLNIGLLIAGLKDVRKGFEIKAEAGEEAPSELEKLLGHIKPLF